MEITAFAPDHGPAQTQVTLTLTDMPADATAMNTLVCLGGTQMGGTPIVNPTGGTIRITVDGNGQSGDFAVLIMSDADGQVGAQSAEIFRFERPEAEPDITSVLPNPARVGSQVTITGANLGEVQFVRIGNVSVTAIQHAGGGTRINFRLPQMAPGSYRVYGNSRNYGNIAAPRMLAVVGG